jgi:hypothetical protein
MRKSTGRSAAWHGVLLAGALVVSTSAFAQTPSATGHGQISGKGGTVQVFSFSANVQADGGETGQGEILYRTTLKGGTEEARIHIDIDCVTIDGNRAILSGIVTQSSDGTSINDRVVIAVADNGEGINDPPDTMSVLLIDDATACISCKSKMKLLLQDIDRGNIQVRLQ